MRLEKIALDADVCNWEMQLTEMWIKQQTGEGVATVEAAEFEQMLKIRVWYVWYVWINAEIIADNFVRYNHCQHNCKMWINKIKLIITLIEWSKVNI